MRVSIYRLTTLIFADRQNQHSGRLIIIDEAEHLPYKSLKLLRRIYDKAQVGILLVGMPRLIMNERRKRQYIQLYSRVGISTRLNYHHYQQFKDIVLLQKIFNHSSPSTTLRYIGIEQEEIDQSYNNFIL